MSEFFSSHDSRDLNRIAAKGILEKMNNIRRGINTDITAKRMIWELVQNAKDAALICQVNGSDIVNIHIRFKDNAFIFSHDNGYFKNENIRGIIRRLSSSDKDKKDLVEEKRPTGKFGTGFMTTHLMSDKVVATGTFQLAENEYCDFKLPINRKGDEISEIVESFNDSFQEVEASIKNSAKYNFNASDKFYTSFEYQIDDIESRGYTKRTLNFLSTSVAASMAFNSSISSIKLCIDKNEYGYGIQKISEAQLQSDTTVNLKIIRLETQDPKVINRSFAKLSKGNVSILIPLNIIGNFYEIEYPAQELPRIFIDFPLCGTESMNIPFIINCPDFEPTEPRDGISLTDHKDKDTIRNSEIYLQAFELYRSFIREYQGNLSYSKFHRLALLKLPEEEKWISNDWYTTKMLEPVKQWLKGASLVSLRNGQRVTIEFLNSTNKVGFPSHENEEVRKRIWNLYSKVKNLPLPTIEDVDEWYEISKSWNACNKLTVKSLTEKIAQSLNLKNLKNLLEQDDLLWLNEYYDLLNYEKNFIQRIKTNEYAVIPNQNGILKNNGELKVDKIKDEPIKDILKDLGSDIREDLLDLNVSTNSRYTNDLHKQITYYPYEISTAISKVNELLKNPNIDSGKKSEAVRKLFSITIVNNQDLQDRIMSLRSISQKLKADLVYEQMVEIQCNLPELWDEAIKFRIDQLIDIISSHQNLNNLINNLNYDYLTTLVLLNQLISFFVNNDFKGKLDLKTKPILPDQNGIFKTKEQLSKDAGDIDEELKTIAEKLGITIRSELLDQNINLDFVEERTIGLRPLSNRVNFNLNEKLNDPSNRDSFQEVFLEFYYWLEKNPENARTYFSDILASSHLLLDHKTVARKMKEADTYNSIMQDFNINSAEDLREILRNQTSKSLEKTKVIDKNDLVTLGITTQEEFEEFKKNNTLKFDIGSFGTADFEYVKGIIERAVRRVLEYLKKDRRYDLHSDIESILVSAQTPTVITGVKKNNRPINLVIRPSDSQKVHVYYIAEFEALKHEDTEFWIDDGLKDPEILTIGKILNYTKTSIIPLSPNNLKI